jgi:hypothetical protein
VVVFLAVWPGTSNILIPAGKYNINVLVITSEIVCKKHRLMNITTFTKPEY